MMTSRLLISAVIFGAATAAFADSSTPEQQAACRPDVRQFCHHLKMGEGDDAFLQCLQAHREKLSAPCRNVLQGYGK